MSQNIESIPRNKSLDPSQRPRPSNTDSYLLNLPPPPHTLIYPTANNRPSPIPGNFNIPPPPSSSMSGEAISTFHKERLHDVLQQGLGTYVYIENYGLVPKLNYF